MKLILQTPKKALKALLKQKPARSEIDLFKFKLIDLLDKLHIIENQPQDETEEHLKNNLRDFLRDTWYIGSNAINTKDKKDLVIHLGKSTDSEVGVIIEAKRPTNVSEMISPNNLNKKALHELILYYFNERQNGNNQLKQLISTNINEWYIIDANHFDKHIYRNLQIRKLYETKLNDRKDNPWFYEEISKIITGTDEDIPCIYFNILEYETILRNQRKEDDKELISLYKILSPQYLLKSVSPNDSNTLNATFYRELLHILGLEETREGTKNIIRRIESGRNPASLIELTIDALKTEDSFHRISDIKTYGENREEQTFNIALELCITWINRILFLKLLEGQLITFHQGNNEYRFLNYKTINDFDELFKLFHKVLAVKNEERTEAIKNKYQRIPYLNSSLFEISPIEDQTIKINSLENNGQLELFSATVLKDIKKKTGKLLTVQYLFGFLDAYDFASEGGEDVQEENKSIINASVLGKVFEKINGYKDGSIFTPGFITMYMGRESIRLTIVDKFNEYCQVNNLKQIEIKRVEDIYELIPHNISRKKANEIINSIKICDPAVGSGHFLVSSLNEIIAIKNDLKIIEDKQGKSLNRYEISVDNDELIITDEDGEIFHYNPNNKESQRIQETLFQEKQTIIENCLFGVDINPKSVLICRLRLWIELLKNAYYVQSTDTLPHPNLETLPNIDINIKCGNSLLSRFPIDADLSKALKSIKYDIKAYRGFVHDYKNEKSREVKKGLQKIIDNIKSDFRTEIFNNDPKVIRLNKLSGELFNLLNQTRLFEEDEQQKKARTVKQQHLENELNKLAKEIEEIKTNAMYKNAFEWRFEFPEVLNNNGEFEGFDLIIGNPPYFSISSEKSLQVLSSQYETYIQTGDIYALFYELGLRILKQNGFQNLIVSNKWMRANYGESLRKYILRNSNLIMLLDFGQNLVFENAIVHASIILAQKTVSTNNIKAFRFPGHSIINYETDIFSIIKNKIISINTFDEKPWNIVDNSVQELKTKIELSSKKLKDWKLRINFGLKTGLNEAFIIDADTKNFIFENEPQSRIFIKPILRGRDTRKYICNFKDVWILNIPKGYTIKSIKYFTANMVHEPVPRYGYVEYDDAWVWFSEHHPLIARLLLPFKPKAEKRNDQGDYWWELRACAYIGEFENPKIVFSEIVSQPQFYYDEDNYYPEATVFFITGEQLKYLTAILNSKAATFFFKTFYMGGELVGKIRYKKSFLEQLPIPVPLENLEKQINSLVDQIISDKKQDKDSSEAEQLIDNFVYRLYSLSEDEIAIIENNMQTEI